MQLRHELLQVAFLKAAAGETSIATLQREPPVEPERGEHVERELARPFVGLVASGRDANLGVVGCDREGVLQVPVGRGPSCQSHASAGCIVVDVHHELRSRDTRQASEDENRRAGPERADEVGQSRSTAWRVMASAPRCSVAPAGAPAKRVRVAARKREGQDAEGRRTRLSDDGKPAQTVRLSAGTTPARCRGAT